MKLTDAERRAILRVMRTADLYLGHRKDSLTTIRNGELWTRSEVQHHLREAAKLLRKRKAR